MKTAILARLKRLETVRAVEHGNGRLKIEFAYLKLLPRGYEGPRYTLKVGQRPDGRDECEERPGPPPANHAENQAPNVMRVYLVTAPETWSEVENGASADERP